MNYLTIDLELEQPSTNSDTPDSVFDTSKIIQIGYVITDIHSGEVKASRCIHINVGHPISQYIKKLTGITDEDIASGIDLMSAYSLLVEDAKAYETSRIILEWGQGDSKSLLGELIDLGLKREDWYFGRYNDNGLNVKHLYRSWAEANGIGANGGLKKSMGKLKLEWQNLTSERGLGAHNAMNDAYNTARVYSHLLQKLRD